MEINFFHFFVCSFKKLPFLCIAEIKNSMAKTEQMQISEKRLKKFGGKKK